MKTVTIPCDCNDEEHGLEVEGEAAGLYAPAVGDSLPCGRQITNADMKVVWERLNDRLADEGE